MLSHMCSQLETIFSKHRDISLNDRRRWEKFVGFHFLSGLSLINILDTLAIGRHLLLFKKRWKKWKTQRRFEWKTISLLRIFCRDQKIVKVSDGWWDRILFRTITFCSWEIKWTIIRMWSTENRLKVKKKPRLLITTITMITRRTAKTMATRVFTVSVKRRKSFWEIETKREGGASRLFRAEFWGKMEVGREIRLNWSRKPSKS